MTVVVDPRIKAAIEPVREELFRRLESARQRAIAYNATATERTKARARADAFHEAILLLAGVDR